MTEPRTVVLVIDDTEFLREYVTEVLQETGRYQVVEAATGRCSSRCDRASATPAPTQAWERY